MFKHVERPKLLQGVSNASIQLSRTFLQGHMQLSWFWDQW